MRGDATAKPSPLFPAYGKINHFKNYPYLFEEDEEVVVTEKVHGTNFRAGWVPTQMDTLWKRVKRWCGLLPQWEFVFGSHNVQLDSVEAWKGFYPHNVYHEAVQQYELCRRIPLGTIVYGEIYGAGIQKGYTYGLHESRSLVLFDARIQVGPMQWYVSWSELESLALKIGLPTVPVVYRGPYRKALVTTWEAGPSLLGEQAHREGCVVKPATEQTCWIGRRMLRSINPEYLLRAESEWH
jgi:RNA ligase (TIGR02306 family)